MKTTKLGIACEECGAMLLRDIDSTGETDFNVRCAKCKSLWRASITKKTVVTLLKITLVMVILWTTTYYLTAHPEIFAHLFN